MATERAVKRPGEHAGCDVTLIARLIEVIEADIIPLTREGVRNGNKVFGAAMLRKSDHSTILAATNRETLNPLWHGEIYAIQKYYEMVNAEQSKWVDPKDVIFLSTHEPCTMCLSAIAWGGYDNFYYLFSHEDSRDSFEIGHDLRILKQVFEHDPGGYVRKNEYWTAYGIVDIVKNCGMPVRKGFLERLEDIRKIYAQMSELYQANKGDARNIPLE